MVLKTDDIGGKDKQTMKQNRELENRSSHLRKTDRNSWYCKLVIIHRGEIEFIFYVALLVDNNYI